jgi:hypothetical protein
MPVGKEGEMAHVAPLTLTIPVGAPVLEFHVLLPVTETGGALVSELVLPPSPNRPFASLPQHFASPLSRIAQV